ncbi:Zn-ribbon domain-containing OB-fold protein [Pseudomonas sp. MUP55]|uniref:Zn-ribbon domain-containing OB-fold protein n=1 Tax=Pseudomonas sp. MUP55 TaxID=3087234 RepID=UPI002A5ACA95|nr:MULTISPECIES: OB-fold domain-containing protein [unclassified Pseudomonas]WPN92151.1 OB-fold domain-containing protein [Pseudomonas sp. MUP56]WPN97676.1 OB-fold domain-containing protein [Pseudomonas sp. MUP55]
MHLTSPHITPESAPFWEAANRGQLLLRRCLDTGKAFFYPRDHSPFTGSAATDWIVASGNASLYSFSYSGQADEAYCIAYVTLDEGPTMLSAIRCDDPHRLRIGQRLKVTFASTPNGQKVPVFELSHCG